MSPELATFSLGWNEGPGKFVEGRFATYCVVDFGTRQGLWKLVLDNSIVFVEYNSIVIRYDARHTVMKR